MASQALAGLSEAIAEAGYDSWAFARKPGFSLSRPTGHHQPGQGEQRGSTGSAAETIPLGRRSRGYSGRGSLACSWFNIFG